MVAVHASRRAVLKATGAVGLGLAMPMILSTRGRTQGGTETINFQLAFLLNNNQMGQIVADKLGYFEEEKLAVNTLPGGPSMDGIAIVAAGQAEMGVVSSSPNLMMAVSQKIPVKAILSQMQEHPYTFYSRPDTPVRTPQDMIGKKIGVNQTGRILVSALLKVNGIPEDQVEIVTIGAELTPLLTKQADVVTNWATQPTATQKLGPVEAMRLWDHGVQLYGQVQYVNLETLERRPEPVAAFVRAVARGWGYVYENPDKAIEIYLNENDRAVRADEEMAMPLVLQYMFNENTRRDGWGTFDPALWQKQINLYDSLGQFTAGKPNVDDVITMSVLDATKDARPKFGRA